MNDLHNESDYPSILPLLMDENALLKETLLNVITATEKDRKAYTVRPKPEIVRQAEILLKSLK